MKKHLKSILLVVTLLVATLLPSSFASAQSTQQSTSTRCTTSQARLNAMITRIDSLKTSRTTAYDGLVEKTEKLITSAKTSGYDVSALTTANDTIKAKIVLFADKSSVYLTSLTATKNLSCGNSDSEYAASLTASRTHLAALRMASADVRAAFKDHVFPALKEYATWLAEQTDTEQESQ